MAAARKVPDVDYAAAWASLSSDVQASIGALAIERAFLTFASTVFEDQIVYLGLPAAEAAQERATRADDDVAAIVERSFPELYGKSATDDDPTWTDPAWARPFKRRHVCIDVIIRDDEARP